ncbi:MAG: hypothetical protein IPI67_07440 [Myxococcales bacterium]|nr:hypothetical protein [Myxococcales bacterium]
MRRTRWLVVALMLLSLLACKSGKKGRSSLPPEPTTAPVKQQFRPSAALLEKVCEGAGVPSIEPQPRDKASAALFVRAEPGGKLEYKAYEDFVANRETLAVNLEDASVVVCLDVTKKKKLKTCSMKAMDPTKGGGTLNTYSYEYVVTLRETSTGKVLSEQKKTRVDDKCPDFHAFKKSEEDLELPYEVSAGLAVYNYRAGK